MQVHITPKSANAKTGPIPVSTTERASCPPDCAMRAECYAASGPLALHWAAVSNGTRGTSWGQFCDTVAAMPAVDQVQAIALGLIDVVPQAVRRMAVHEHLARGQPHS